MDNSKWPAAAAFVGFLLVLFGGAHIFFAWLCKKTLPLILGERLRAVANDPRISEFYAVVSRAGWAVTLLGFSLVIAANAVVNFK